MVKPAALNYLKHAEFEISLDGGTTGNDYAGTCRSIRCEPSGATATFYGMTPDAVWEENGGHQLTIEFADDYDAADSLWNFAFDHDGEQVTITFRPKVGGQAFRVTTVMKSPGIGGTTREVATSTLALACSAPVKVA